MTPLKKILISLLGVAIALVAHLSVIDNKGLEYTEEGLKRSLVTFGVSRGLNGVISVVQGTEVAVEPVGIGMTFTPGQILDPVNDLVERFSTIVLIAGTAFGVQRVVLEVTSAQIFSILLTLSLIAALCAFWMGERIRPGFRHAAYKLFATILIVRFAVPVIAISGELFYQQFLQPQFEESSQQLQLTTSQLQDIQEDTTPQTNEVQQERSFFESAKDLYRSATDSLDFEQQLESFMTAAENISEHAVKLMVVFVFQTILFPLVSIWLVIKGIGVLIRISPRPRMS